MLVRSRLSYLKGIIRRLFGRSQRQSLSAVPHLGIYLGQKHLELFERVRLRPSQVFSVSPEDLYCAIHYDNDDTFRLFWTDENGHFSRSIFHSPHYKLLKFYCENGRSAVLSQLPTLDYYRFLDSFNVKGYKTDLVNPEIRVPVRPTPESILARVDGFIELYENIRRTGYLEGTFKGAYIAVLRVPFVQSRFGMRVEDFRPYEIFSGHHRASCLAILGVKKFPVVLLEDVLYKG